MNVFGRSVNLYYTALSESDSLALLGNALRLLMGLKAPDDTRWSRAFQEEFQDAVGAAAAYTFPSARSALYATLKAMGIGRGDEVLITGFTCVAVPNPIMYLGARPLYVDIHSRTFNMNAAQMEGKITPRTRAVVVQHTFGNPADMDAIMALARRRGLAVIEDCALALGSSRNGRAVGSTGDAAIVSFELSKTISAGWGGVAWTRDPGLGRRLAEIQAQCPFMSRVEAARRSLQVGLSFFLYHPRLFWMGRYIAAGLYRTGLFSISTVPEEERGLLPRGFLRRVPDAHWQVLARQFATLERIAAKSRSLAAVYQQVLSERGVLTFPHVDHGALPAWTRYPFLVADRQDMRRFFARRGVEIGEWFNSPISGAADLARFGYRHGECPVAEFVCRHVVNVPLGFRLSPADALRIRRYLEEYLTTRSENQEFAEFVNRTAPPEYAGHAAAPTS